MERNFAGKYRQLGKKKKIWQLASKHSTKRTHCRTTRKRDYKRSAEKAKKVDVRQRASVNRDLRKLGKASGLTWSTILESQGANKNARNDQKHESGNLLSLHSWESILHSRWRKLSAPTALPRTVQTQRWSKQEECGGGNFDHHTIS